MVTKSMFGRDQAPVKLFWLSLLLLLNGCLPGPTRPSTGQTGQPGTQTPISEHLTLGNPSDASPTDPDNYLLLKPQLTLSFNRARGIANWVSWHLDRSWRGDAARTKTFRPDPDLPAGYSTIRSADYERTGFDRGHLCPSEDRDSSPEANAATFVLTNVVPQAPSLNRGIWKSLEDYARKRVDEGSEVYIIAGVTGTGGTGDQGQTNSIANGKITVPASFWKVLLIMPNGDNDLQRIGPNTQVVAVWMPNQPAETGLRWTSYRLTVGDLEQRTGLHFFTNLPADIQLALKRQTSTGY